MSLVGDHSKKIICVFFATVQTKPCFDFWYSSLTLGKLTGEAWFCRVLTLSMQLWSQLKHPHKSWWGWGESFRNLFVSIFESTVICPNPFGCVMVSRDIWTTHICMPSFDYIPFLVPTFAGSFPLFDSCRCWHSHTFVPPENYHLTVYKSFDDHFWQWMTSIVYLGECLHIDTHKRWQMANLVSNCEVKLWWLWMFMAYI